MLVRLSVLVDVAVGVGVGVRIAIGVAVCNCLFVCMCVCVCVCVCVSQLWVWGRHVFEFAETQDVSGQPRIVVFRAAGLRKLALVLSARSSLYTQKMCSMEERNDGGRWILCTLC